MTIQRHQPSACMQMSRLVIADQELQRVTALRLLRTCSVNAERAATSLRSQCRERTQMRSGSAEVCRTLVLASYLMGGQMQIRSTPRATN